MLRKKHKNFKAVSEHSKSRWSTRPRDTGPPLPQRRYGPPPPPKSKEMSLHASIVNRPRNGYETVDNIKVVSINSFKQLEVAIDCATN